MGEAMSCWHLKVINRGIQGDKIKMLLSAQWQDIKLGELLRGAERGDTKGLERVWALLHHKQCWDEVGQGGD